MCQLSTSSKHLEMEQEFQGCCLTASGGEKEKTGIAKKSLLLPHVSGDQEMV